MSRALLFLLVLVVACHCSKVACGKVTAKVWSHITGACYVVAQNSAWPSETIYIQCDTVEFHHIEIGQLWCGNTIQMNNNEAAP